MMANGERWQYQPDKQDEIVVQYEFSQSDFDENLKHQLNRGLVKPNWLGQVSEGVIENVEEVWMHPFRMNQYNFTEVAPFPHIRYPLEIGRMWTDGIEIQKGWGDWENSSIQSEYEVKNKTTIRTEYGRIDDCWEIHSKSIFKLGETTFHYWFNEELGFVKMDYTNYGNQTLQIELIEINEL